MNSGLAAHLTTDNYDERHASLTDDPHRLAEGGGRPPEDGARACWPVAAPARLPRVHRGLHLTTGGGRARPVAPDGQPARAPPRGLGSVARDGSRAGLGGAVGAARRRGRAAARRDRGGRADLSRAPRAWEPGAGRGARRPRADRVPLGTLERG